MRLTSCLACCSAAIAILNGCAQHQRDWREQGVRVVRSDQLDSNTKQTAGMTRAAAINHAIAGARKLWAGTVVVAPGVAAGAHHHGELETVVYVVRGVARLRWGERLEYFADAGPGDFVYVPPFVPHQEINPGDEPVEVVLVRSGAEPVVVNLDVPGAVDSPREVRWDSGFHQRP